MEKPVLSSVLLVLSVILAISISGCTIFDGQMTPGNGVVVENFEPDFPRVYADESFKLQMKIRNTGSVDALNVYPKLYNIGSSTGEISDLEISCEGSCDADTRLLAPDPERGTTGESKTCMWDCYAPVNIPKGLTATFNPSVRLYYIYATHTIKSITLVSQNELRSLQTQGKALPSDTVSTTSGPLSLDVVVKGPIRYWEGENTVTFPVNINIQNSAGGTSCVSDDKIPIPIISGIPTMPTVVGFNFIPIVFGCEDSSRWDKVRLIFHKDDKGSVRIKECYGIENENGAVIDLWKGQSRTITCEMEMDVPSSHSTGFIQKNLRFSLSYTYFTDSSTRVEVIGRDVPVS